VPEGDSLRRIAARLQALVGERVEAEAPHPRAAASGVAAAVDGRVLESVEAVGKNLLLHFEGGVTVRSHLRLSGRWRVEPRGTARAGRPWLVLRGGAWEAVQWNGPLLSLAGEAAVRRLGPDVLEDAVDVGELAGRVRAAGPERLLGEVLLDQRVLAGIGNMWMAESLHRARVSPFLTVRDTTAEELALALEAARGLMRASIAGRRPARAVYRRSGRTCPRCGGPISARGLGDANRRAYWCSGCQRGPGGG
jgi:endonuclease-8